MLQHAWRGTAYFAELFVVDSPIMQLYMLKLMRNSKLHYHPVQENGKCDILSLWTPPCSYQLGLMLRVLSSKSDIQHLKNGGKCIVAAA